MRTMGPTVAVEVAPPPASPQRLLALLDACSAALPAGSCRSADELAAAPAASAHVTWIDASNVRIEVEIAGGEPARLTRDFAFESGDPPLQRFRTVGLAIATLVDELRVRNERALAPPDEGASETTPAAPPITAPAPESPQSPVPAPKTPLSASPKAVPVAPRASRPPENTTGVEVGGLVGTGLVSGPARVGLYLRAVHDVDSLPVYAGLDLAYASLTSSSDPRVTWNEFALGGGVHLSASNLRFELGLSALLRRTHASAADPATGVEDSGDSWLPGLGLTARALWPERSRISLALGANASACMREVSVTNADEEIGRISAYSAALVGGLRLAW